MRDPKIKKRLMVYLKVFFQKNKEPTTDQMAKFAELTMETFGVGKLVIGRLCKMLCESKYIEEKPDGTETDKH